MLIIYVQLSPEKVEMMKEYLKKLNHEQFAAATHFCGAALVLSGPGSGKTSVITARAMYLIDEKKIIPERLLTVTFGRAAASEMHQRFVEKASEYNLCFGKVPDYGTLHGLSFRLLRKGGFLSKNVKVLCNNEKNQIIRNIWKLINLPTDNRISEDYLNLISGLISKAKLFRNSEKESEFKRNIQVRNFERIFMTYEKYKRENCMIDFDDMIFETAVQLSENRIFRELVTGLYDFVQIDEGQDLSIPQVEIIKFLGKSGNVFMVADDDQGIYGFRGADINSLKQYEDFFAGCKRYCLGRNYRSDRRIVDLANVFIAGNSGRYSKELFTLNDYDGDVELIKAYDVCAQARYAAEIAIANSAAGLTCGILYRKNISALMPLLYLYHQSHLGGINAAYSIAGGFTPPAKYEIVKHYLKLIASEEKRNGISVKSPYEIYRKMIRDKSLNEFLEMREAHGCAAKENVYIIEFIKLMSRLCNDYEKITNFLKYANGAEGTGNIFLSTVHSSKGLEYDSVVIVDVSEGEFPQKTSVSEDEVEEERRLFYVAMTRAKRNLYIISPDKCGNERCFPSLFFRETAKALKA